MSEEEGFGKASLERQFSGYKRFKMVTPDEKKGEEKTRLVVRLLPSMKSYRNTGAWKFFFGVHFGYEGTNSRDPQGKGRPRPFLCIEQKDSNKQIVVHCPKCDQMSKYRGQAKARESVLATEHKIEDLESSKFSDIKRNDQKLKVVNDWLKKNNCDKKFYTNAMNEAREFGVLTLSYSTATKVLEPKLKDLQNNAKLDPFDPSAGVWVVFTRTGRNPNVTDTAEILMIEGEDGAFRRGKAPLTEEEVKKALKVCPDLSNIHQEIVRVLPATAIQALVDCNGDKAAVDAIWAPYDKAFDAAKAARIGKPVEAPATVPVEDDQLDLEDVAEETQSYTASEAMVAAVETVVNRPTVQPVEEVDAEEAALLAQMEALKAKRAAGKKTPAVTKPAEETMGAVENPEDFLKQFDANR